MLVIALPFCRLAGLPLDRNAPPRHAVAPVVLLPSPAGEPEPPPPAHGDDSEVGEALDRDGDEAFTGRQFGAAMPDRRDILTCSCEDTMPLDTQALRHGCRGARLVTGHQFCRHEFQRARELVATGAPITMGCTQEAPVFRDIAAESGGDVTFVNLRGNAGSSADAASAGPKMAAPAAAAAEPMPDVPFVDLKRKGGILVYSRDERAIEAANCAFRRCWRIVEGVPRLVAESEDAFGCPGDSCSPGYSSNKKRRVNRTWRLFPVCEELIFRGFIFRGWSQTYLGPVGTIWLTALLFGLSHTYSIYAVLDTTCFGLVAGWTRWRSRSIIVPILLHVIKNCLATIAGFFDDG